MTKRIIMGILRRVKCRLIRLRRFAIHKRGIKISAVVPTYNTAPEALARLIRSLDKQTLSKAEYEVIFIDDGSTADTFRRLKKLAATRPNVIVRRIANSGWGSRPRNVGTKLARGKYVLYLDHDDTVYPEAFDKVYRYGTAHHADVVNAKEVRTNGWFWGWEQFRENNPSAQSLGIVSMLPMTPHKFYRRAFLQKHGITFNEGARVLWEDVYFNTKVFINGASVAILSDSPAYHWIATGQNTSSTFGRDPHEKWDQIRKLITFVRDTMPEGGDRTFMLRHWYQTRVLGVAGAWLMSQPEARIAIEFDYARRVAAELIPRSIDASLTPLNKVRAYLLRAGRLDEVMQLVKHDARLAAKSTAADVHWEDGKLFIRTTAHFTRGDGSPYPLHARNGRVIRDVPADLEKAVPAELLDWTDAIGRAAYEATIKGRKTRVTWAIPVDFSDVGTKDIGGGLLHFAGSLRLHFDIQTAAMGAPLDNQPWDVATRFSAFGFIFHGALTAPEGLLAPAIIAGRTAVAYHTQGGFLTVDVGSKIHSVVKAAKPVPADATLVRPGNGDGDRAGATLTLRLPAIHVWGYSHIAGAIELHAADSGDADTSAGAAAGANADAGGGFGQPVVRAAAVLIGDEAGARVVATFKVPQGRYWLVTVFEGRKADTGLVIQDGVICAG